MSKLDPSLEQHFSDLETKYNLPSNLLKSVAYTESRYNSNASSPVGASGMFQFMPATAKQYGVDVADPYSSADGAARMYANLLKQNGGDLNKALAGYNWGQGNLNKKGLDNAPQETRNYISQINNLMGSVDNSKKNSNNGTKQDFYNGLNKSMDKVDKDNEELQAYKEMQQHQNQNDEMQAYQEMMQHQAQVQQANAPMNINQAVNNNNSFTTNKNGQLNNQSAQPQQNGIPDALRVTVPQSLQAPVAQAPVQNTNAQAIASKLLQVSDPAHAAALFNNASPQQQEYIKGILQDEFNRQNPQGTSMLGNIWGGVLRSAQKTNNAMTQMIAAGKGAITGNNEDLQNVNQKIARDNATNQFVDTVNPSTARTIGEVGGDVAQFVTPGAIAKLGVGSTGLARAGALATEGAAGTMMQNPVENANTASDVLKGKAIQGVEGAILNPIATGAGEFILDKAGKVINTVKNVNKELPAASQAAKQDFENAGIRYAANDIAPRGSAIEKKGQSFTAKNEEMRNFVNAQQQDVNNAFESFKGSLQKPEIQNIAKDTGLDKALLDTENVYHGAAKQIANKIDSVDVADPNAILKVSAEAKYIADKAKSSNLYDESTRLAPANSKIPIDNTSKVLSDVTDYFKQLKTTTAQNNMKPVINDINEAVGKIKSGQDSFKDIDQLIKEIGNSARQAIKTGDDNAARIYNDVKSSLTKDKEAYINSLPDSTEALAYKKAYGTAQSFNKNAIQSIKNDNSLFQMFSQFNRSGNVNIPDGLIQKWVQKGQTSKIQNLFDMLPGSGKQAVQQGIVNKIVKDATDQAGNVNPQKLVKAYNSYKDATSGNTPLNVVFDANTKQALDNLVRTVNNIKNIGYNTANPVNGFQNRDLIGNAKLAGAITAAPFTKGLSLAEPIYRFIKDKAFLTGMTDPKMQKYLINLNGLNPSSSAYAKKLAELSGYIATASYNKNKE